MLTIFIAIVIGGVLGAAWADEGFGAVASARWRLARCCVRGSTSGRSLRCSRRWRSVQAGAVGLPSRLRPTSRPARRVDVPLDRARAGRARPSNSTPAPMSAQAAVPSEADRIVETASRRRTGHRRVDAPAARPTRTPSPMWNALRGWLFGGNTIVKAGIGILFIGLAFLAKYASEHVQVPVELRLAGDRRRRRSCCSALGWRLRAAPRRLRAGAAGRRGRGAVPDAVRRVPLLRRARGRRRCSR